MGNETFYWDGLSTVGSCLIARDFTSGQGLTPCSAVLRKVAKVLTVTRVHKVTRQVSVEGITGNGDFLFLLESRGASAQENSLLLSNFKARN